MKSYIHLIRHGITIGNEQGWFYGSMDVPLADKGISQLRDFADNGIYPDDTDAVFYTSGMLRTEQTFAIIYGDRPHKIIDKLQELRFGDYEGTPYEVMNANMFFKQWSNDIDGNLHFPGGGDSNNSFIDRVREGFEELQTNHFLDVIRLRNRGITANSIIVCHGGVIGGIMSTLFPDHKDNMWQWVPDPGRGYNLTFDDCKAIEYSAI